MWPIVLTAFLTLVATLVVHLTIQFYAVPRVETRKRREDRWERDLLALGELLTFEQPQAADSMFQALTLRRALAQWREEPDTNKVRLDQLSAENDEHIREYVDAYRRMAARIDWLADSATTFNKYADGMRPFVRALLFYRLASREAEGLGIGAYADDLAREEFDRIRDDERQSVRAMVMSIKALIGHPPPQTSLSKRARQRVAHWLSPISRKRAEAQVKREQRKEQPSEN